MIENGRQSTKYDDYFGKLVPMDGDGTEIVDYGYFGKLVPMETLSQS